MDEQPSLYFMGDIHGHLDTMVRHLQHAGLATARGEWRGRDAQLWFMGDFTDRGPDGIGVIDFVMRLQADAARHGGQVGALLGNHDTILLAAKFLPNVSTSGPKGNMYGDWIENGGIVSDLERLESRHIEWLCNLPALARVQDRLLMHADAMFYFAYGETLEAINAATFELLHGRNADRWNELLDFASQRLAFDDRKPGHLERATRVLDAFGGKQIIHGHTPIEKLSGEPIKQVTHAFTYCRGLAVDVDGGIYQGGKGFVFRALPVSTSAHANAHP